MAQTPDDAKKDVQDQVQQTKQNIKDAVTLKPQRQAVSDNISHALQGAENTVKGWAGKAADFVLGPSDKRPDLSAKVTSKPSYKEGTDYVPKTGPAVLHKGEAVLNTKDAAKHREAKGMAHKGYDVADELGGKKEEKPKKEIKHIKTEKAKNGGYIHTHTHTHPEHHPDEQHISADQDAMASHMLQNMGTPNPGEAEADAGQSGVPGAAPGAAAGAAAPPQAGM